MGGVRWEGGRCEWVVGIMGGDVPAKTAAALGFLKIREAEIISEGFRIAEVRRLCSGEKNRTFCGQLSSAAGMHLPASGPGLGMRKIHVDLAGHCTAGEDHATRGRSCVVVSATHRC